MSLDTKTDGLVVLAQDIIFDKEDQVLWRNRLNHVLVCYGGVRNPLFEVVVTGGNAHIVDIGLAVPHQKVYEFARDRRVPPLAPAPFHSFSLPSSKIRLLPIERRQKIIDLNRIPKFAGTMCVSDTVILSYPDTSFIADWDKSKHNRQGVSEDLFGYERKYKLQYCADTRVKFYRFSVYLDKVSRGEQE